MADPSALSDGGKKSGPHRKAQEEEDPEGRPGKQPGAPREGQELTGRPAQRTGGSSGIPASWIPASWIRHRGSARLAPGSHPPHADQPLAQTDADLPLSRLGPVLDGLAMRGQEEEARRAGSASRQRSSGDELPEDSEEEEEVQVIGHVN